MTGVEPLPLEPFRYYRFGERTVHLDGCVEVEAAYYGAPPGWIGRRVQVQWNDVHVRLIEPTTGQLLREHLRGRRGHHRIDETEIDRLLATQDRPVAQRPLGNRSPALIVSLSGRNQLRGFVDEIRVEGLLGQVRLRIGDQLLTAVVTRDAIDELKLRRGDRALAIVKSTEVMIAREAESPAESGQQSRQTARRPRRART